MLLRYLRDRYDVAVLLPEEGMFSEVVANEGMPFFVIPTLRANTISKIFRLVRREGFDLVYGNNLSGCSRNAMLATRLAGKPFIWHAREMKWHWTWRQGVYLRGANAIVAVSQACADSLARFYPVRSINVVYNGVEISSFNGDRATARPYLAEQAGLPTEADYIINVSHLTSRKGHEQAIEVMAHVIKERPDAHLLVVGSLDRDLVYTDKIRALIKQQDLANQIHLLGLRRDIPRLLLGSDIFLHTAKQDPQPRSILEAMAAGLPIVAFAIDGVAETVIEGETGYLLSKGDVSGMAKAIASLLAIPTQRIEMGQRGRDRVQNHFTAAGTAAQVSRIIDKVLA
jgi:glycosyltransferase involved in cell wall biosynthesis